MSTLNNNTRTVKASATPKEQHFDEQPQLPEGAIMLEQPRSGTIQPLNFKQIPDTNNPHGVWVANKSENGSVYACSSDPYPNQGEIKYLLDIPEEELTYEELGEYIKELADYHRNYSPVAVRPYFVPVGFMAELEEGKVSFWYGHRVKTQHLFAETTVIPDDFYRDRTYFLETRNHNMPKGLNFEELTDLIEKINDYYSQVCEDRNQLLEKLNKPPATA